MSYTFKNGKRAGQSLEAIAKDGDTNFLNWVAENHSVPAARQEAKQLLANSFNDLLDSLLDKDEPDQPIKAPANVSQLLSLNLEQAMPFLDQHGLMVIWDDTDDEQDFDTANDEKYWRVYGVRDGQLQDLGFAGWNVDSALGYDANYVKEQETYLASIQTAHNEFEADCTAIGITQDNQLAREVWAGVKRAVEGMTRKHFENEGNYTFSILDDTLLTERQKNQVFLIIDAYLGKLEIPKDKLMYKMAQYLNQIVKSELGAD